MTYLFPVVLMMVLVSPIGIALIGDQKITFTRLPIYIGLGLGVYGVSLMIIGYYHVSCLLPLTLTGASLVFLHDKKISITFDGIYSLALLLVSIHHFTVAANILQWPPIGDAISHGTYVALIQYLKKIPLTYEPYAPDIVAFYPLGFHTLTASLLPVMNVEPGQGLLVTSTMAISIIPSLLFTATWLLSQSKIPATLAYLSTWVTYTKWRLFITGLYYLGVYPFLVGLALSLTYLCLLILESREKLSEDTFLLTGAIICGALIFIYPSFFLFTITIHGIYYLSKYNVWRKPKALISVGLGVAIIISKLPFFALINQVDKYIDTSTRPEFIYGNRVLVRELLINSINGWAVLVAVIPMAFFMINRKNRYISTLYLLLFTTVFCSYNRTLFEGGLWFTLPNRSWFLLINLSWITILTEANHLVHHLTRYRGSINIRIKGINQNTIRKPTAILFTASLLFYGLPFTAFYPSLQEQFIDNVYPKNRKESWYVSDVAVWGMLEWVDKNVAPRDLIMTDLSWSALWLQSYGVHNTTNSYLTAMDDQRRALRVNYAWRYPEDAAYLEYIIKQYNISYIMVTSDYRYFDWHWLNGTQNISMKKPVTPEETIIELNKHPFLSRVYKENNNAVYKVVEEPP